MKRNNKNNGEDNDIWMSGPPGQPEPIVPIHKINEVNAHLEMWKAEKVKEEAKAAAIAKAQAEIIPFGWDTAHGLYIVICLVYFLCMYGLVGLDPRFIADKAEAVQHGRNVAGWIPNQYIKAEQISDAALKAYESVTSNVQRFGTREGMK